MRIGRGLRKMAKLARPGAMAGRIIKKVRGGKHRGGGIGKAIGLGASAPPTPAVGGVSTATAPAVSNMASTDAVKKTIGG